MSLALVQRLLACPPKSASTCAIDISVSDVCALPVGSWKMDCLHSAAAETACAQRSTYEYDNQQRPPYTEALGRALLSSYMHDLPPLPPLDGLLEVDESAISVFWFCTPKSSTSLNAHTHALYVCVSSTRAPVLQSSCMPVPSFLTALCLGGPGSQSD
jgi:hypothetical protein